jgi:hypothetical protein
LLKEFLEKCHFSFRKNYKLWKKSNPDFKIDIQVEKFMYKSKVIWDFNEIDF